MHPILTGKVCERQFTASSFAGTTGAGFYSLRWDRFQWNAVRLIFATFEQREKVKFLLRMWPLHGTHLPVRTCGQNDKGRSCHNTFLGIVKQSSKIEEVRKLSTSSCSALKAPFCNNIMNSFEWGCGPTVDSFAVPFHTTLEIILRWQNNLSSQLAT